MADAARKAARLDAATQQRCEQELQTARRAAVQILAATRAESQKRFARGEQKQPRMRAVAAVVDGRVVSSRSLGLAMV